MCRKLQHVRRKPRGFRPENETVFRSENKTVHSLSAPRTGADQPAARPVGLKVSLERGPYLPVHMRPVIQPCAPQMLVVDDEAERLDKVELYARTCAKSRHVAGIRRYFRMIKHNMEHSVSDKKTPPQRAETSEKTAEKTAAPIHDRRDRQAGSNQ